MARRFWIRKGTPFQLTALAISWTCRGHGLVSLVNHSGVILNVRFSVYETHAVVGLGAFTLIEPVLSCFICTPSVNTQSYVQLGRYSAILSTPWNWLQNVEIVSRKSRYGEGTLGTAYHSVWSCQRNIGHAKARRGASWAPIRNLTWQSKIQQGETCQSYGILSHCLLSNEGSLVSWNSRHCCSCSS